MQSDGHKNSPIAGVAQKPKLGDKENQQTKSSLPSGVGGIQNKLKRSKSFHKIRPHIDLDMCKFLGANFLGKDQKIGAIGQALHSPVSFKEEKST